MVRPIVDNGLIAEIPLLLRMSEENQPKHGPILPNFFYRQNVCDRHSKTLLVKLEVIQGWSVVCRV